MDEPRRVLVVDDDEGVRTGVAWALEADGFVVDAVADGLEAIQRLETARPALVVLDLSLPGVGGLEMRHSETTPAATSKQSVTATR